MSDLHTAQKFAPFVPYINKGPTDAMIILGPNSKPETSIKILNEYLEDDPYAIDALRTLTAAYLRSGNYLKASETYSRLLKLSPRSAAVAGPVGQPQRRLGDDTK